MMIHGRSVSGHGQVLVAWWRIGGNLALVGKIAGPSPNLQLWATVLDDKIPVIVLPFGREGELRLFHVTA